MSPMSIEKHLLGSVDAVDEAAAFGTEFSSVVRAIKIRIAYQAATMNLLAGMAGVIVVMLGMAGGWSGWNRESSSLIVRWGTSVLGLQMIHLIVCMWFNARPRADLVAERAAVWYTSLALFEGAAFGSASWLMLPAASPGQESFLMIAIALIVMGAVGAQAALRQVAMAFGGALGVAYAMGLFQFDDFTHRALGIGYLLFCGAIVMYARTHEIAITTAINLALRNQQLLALRTEQQEVATRARSDAESARELAERADRAKTTFIAAASHDLRQPMHALVQYVGHLRREDATPATQTIVSRIEDAVKAMADLLNAVLEFTKVSSGAITPHVEVVDFRRLMERIDLQVRPGMEARGLVLRMVCPPCHVLSDEVLLERIVMNIAHNAARYTRAGTVVMRVRIRPDCVRLLIADTGIGISSTEQPKIFEEYYQVDNQGRDRRKGLGLGLAIVRDLCRLLNLRLRLKSIEGRGSAFVLELLGAVAQPGTTREHAPVAVVDYLRGAGVLLIDDDDLARDAVALSLQKFGCRVISGASTAEVLAALAEHPFGPQLVVADYRLAGGATGLDAIAAIDALYSTWCGQPMCLPAILISGDTSPRELKHVADAGYRMLHKPVGLEGLYRELNTLLATATADLSTPVSQT